MRAGRCRCVLSVGGECGLVCHIGLPSLYFLVPQGVLGGIGGGRGGQGGLEGLHGEGGGAGVLVATGAAGGMSGAAEHGSEDG